MSEETGEFSRAVSITRPKGEALPILFDSPHSGRIYPDDFLPAADLDLLTGGEDRFVDDLVVDGPNHGATLIKALFARTYIDPNRRLDDLDPKLLPEDWAEQTAPSLNSRRGVGLIFRLIGNSVPIYDRTLTSAEIRTRIDCCWQPYHEALERELKAMRQRFGVAFHINWHSMQAVGSALAPDPERIRPDFVLGDLDGRSCEPDFIDFVAGALEKRGYSVARNDPYKGAYIVEHYGRPEEGLHTLQIEINRGLYMDHGTLDRSGGFAGLRENLAALAGELARFVRARL